MNEKSTSNYKFNLISYWIKLKLSKNIKKIKNMFSGNRINGIVEYNIIFLKSSGTVQVIIKGVNKFDSLFQIF